MDDIDVSFNLQCVPNKKKTAHFQTKKVEQKLYYLKQLDFKYVVTHLVSKRLCCIARKITIQNQQFLFFYTMTCLTIRAVRK